MLAQIIIKLDYFDSLSLRERQSWHDQSRNRYNRDRSCFTLATQLSVDSIGLVLRVLMKGFPCTHKETDCSKALSTHHVRLYSCCR